MKSDTLKTMVGLLVVAAVVAATFAYGQYQRSHRQASQESKPQAVAVSPQPTSGSNVVATPVSTPAPAGQVAGATATTPLPQAGPADFAGVVGFGAMGVMARLWWRSRRSLRRG